MNITSTGGGEDGEHSGVGFVEISYIFMGKNIFFVETTSFDGVHPRYKFIR